MFQPQLADLAATATFCFQLANSGLLKNIKFTAKLKVLNCRENSESLYFSVTSIYPLECSRPPPPHPLCKVCNLPPSPPTCVLCHSTYCLFSKRKNGNMINFVFCFIGFSCLCALSVLSRLNPNFLVTDMNFNCKGTVFLFILFNTKYSVRQMNIASTDNSDLTV